MRYYRVLEISLSRESRLKTAVKTEVKLRLNTTKNYLVLHKRYTAQPQTG
jgi:hypothetical protein